MLNLKISPLKKKRKIMLPAKSDEKVQESGTHADYRIAWLVASEDALVEIKVQGERFRVHKNILCQHSEYFKTCLNEPFKEASERFVSFDDIEARYMAFYVGVAYSYSSIVPRAHPLIRVSFEADEQKTTLRDYIEVHKLCDRFISEEMAKFMMHCINTSIGDRHRALYRSSTNKMKQRELMREFADAYEAHKTLEANIIKYFCEGIDYTMWDEGMDDLEDRPRFVAMVSKGFARKLHEAQTGRFKLKRKELPGP